MSNGSDATFTPYHLACSAQIGDSETTIEEILRKADDEEYGRICCNCHDYIDGGIDVEVSPNPSGEPGRFPLRLHPLIGTPRC